ncbi:hypothetical protein PAECIP111802_07377 [Paenibacillus allorhizosphaerae]|uniref:Uncharacterized protein n=1 Tax=Paenibacillus allorhizosphaerae TaxID=2849866 RepID=A0ABN7U1T7_9BACL|nr:hypothetical protein PAECIP111802_07377 [Paenibacillus allorhizosphaerae]
MGYSYILELGSSCRKGPIMTSPKGGSPRLSNVSISESDNLRGITIKEDILLSKLPKFEMFIDPRNTRRAPRKCVLDHNTSVTISSSSLRFNRKLDSSPLKRNCLASSTAILPRMIMLRPEKLRFEKRSSRILLSFPFGKCRPSFIDVLQLM